MVFAYGIDGQDQIILPENFGDSSYIRNLFLLDAKNQFQMQSSPPAHNPHRDEYIEGGDFRDTLKHCIRL
jgi:hypothetical protein